jgi:hypothetical protein
MLDRVIDAPAHQGRTDLEQTLAQAGLEAKCLLSLACVISQALPLGRCLQWIEGCGLLANS